MTSTAAVLSQCFSLVELEICIEIQGADNHIQGIQAISLPNLTDLILSHSRPRGSEEANMLSFLYHLKLPALKRISLHAEYSTDVQQCAPLASLIMRSHCTLEEITIEGGENEAYNPALQDLLELCSHVRKLDTNDMIFTDTILTSMAREEILPMLEEWWFTGDVGLSVDLLEEVIKARQQRDTQSGLPILSKVFMFAGKMHALLQFFVTLVYLNHQIVSNALKNKSLRVRNAGLSTYISKNTGATAAVTGFSTTNSRRTFSSFSNVPAASSASNSHQDIEHGVECVEQLRIRKEGGQPEEGVMLPLDHVGLDLERAQRVMGHVDEVSHSSLQLTIVLYFVSLQLRLQSLQTGVERPKILTMEETPVPSDSSHPDNKQPLLFTIESEAASPIRQKHDYVSDAQQEEEKKDYLARQRGPSFLKRLILVVCTLFLFWAALQLRGILYHEKAQVIYASRYSKDYKFRPAASPIITETLKDGCVRIHGAGPAPDPIPLPTPVAKRRVGKAGAGRVRKQNGE
ncbi:hypothetical protein H0H81_011444 [Sphagnurus paluster]|uniref:Uncharacterized protein n=1 Tax=Sphagnurus paluster TaxID=117069 RepID=A0A9P7GPH6_9AGAR|nr:hypothetical protein H0H81_011444 [Sphagnurus paluster]